jgi:hypothetical protein
MRNPEEGGRNMTGWTTEQSNAGQERNIITKMITDDGFLGGLAPLKPEAYLSSPFTKIVAKWAADYWREYGEAPGHHIEDIYEEKKTNGLDGEMALLVAQFLTSISEEQENRESPDPYDLDAAKRYIEARRVQIFFDEAEDVVRRGDVDRFHDLIADFQAKAPVDGASYGDYVYIVGDTETADAVKALADDGIIRPGTILKAIPPLARLGGKHVAVVNGGPDMVEALRVPATLGSLRDVHLDPGSLAGDHRPFAAMGFTCGPDLARRDLKQALHSYIRQGLDFLECDFPEIRPLCGPIESQSINLVVGPPGVGKSFLAQEIAGASSAGRPAMAGRWETPRPAKSLVVDGEMLPRMTQERLKMQRARNCYVLCKAELEADNVTPALNLAEEDVREVLEDIIIRGQFELVIFDNLYSLITGIDGNLAKDWEPVNLWLLRLRAKGVSVILIHHTGKGGDQLGTVAKLFNVNLALSLHKAEEGGEEGCSFNIRIVKQRSRGLGLTGKRYTCEDGTWTVEEDDKAAADERAAQVLKMLASGSTYDEIAKAIGVKSSGSITKIKNGLVKAGLLLEEPGGSGRGRNAKLTLTEAGREKLSSLGEGVG